MPLFLEIPTQFPSIAPICTTPRSQPLVVTPISSTSDNEIDKMEAMMQEMMLGLEKKLQDQSSEIKKSVQDRSSVINKIGNELVTLKRKQAHNRIAHPPYQNASLIPILILI